MSSVIFLGGVLMDQATVFKSYLIFNGPHQLLLTHLIQITCPYISAEHFPRPTEMFPLMENIFYQTFNWLFTKLPQVSITVATPVFFDSTYTLYNGNGGRFTT